MRKVCNGLGWRQVASSVHGNQNVGLAIGCAMTGSGAMGLMGFMMSSEVSTMSILSPRAMMVKTPEPITQTPVLVMSRLHLVGCFSMPTNQLIFVSKILKHHG